jgi:hypothetical protein
MPEMPVSTVPINAPAKTKKCTESPMKVPIYNQVSPGKGDNKEVLGSITTIEVPQNEGALKNSHEKNGSTIISPSKS